MSGHRPILPSRQWAYVPILGLATALMFARLLVMARLLSLEEFAAFNVILIISGLVATFSCFGLFMELQRTLPGLLENAHPEQPAKQMMLALIGAFAVTAAGLVVVLCLWPANQVSLKIGVTGLIHGLSMQLFLIAATESRSRGDPLRYSKQNLFRTGIAILVGLAVVLTTGSAIAVAISEAVVASLVSTAILRRVYARLSVPIHVAMRLARQNLRVIPWLTMGSLVLVSLIVSMSVNFDRWLAAHSLNRESFAHYAFAWLPMTAALSAQALVNASVFPEIARKFASGGRKPAFVLALKSSVFLFILSIIIGIPAIYLTTSIIIPVFYPKYMESSTLIIPIALASAFRLSDFWSSYLLIIGKERAVLAINVTALLLASLAWVILSNHDGAPLHIAILSAFTAFLVIAGACWVSLNASSK